MKEMIGMKVFIETASSRRYTGTIKLIENGFVKLLDKYNALIFIATSDINILQEEK